MGDGRYYTWFQFLSTAYSLLLALILLVSIIYLGLKSRMQRTLKYILLIQVSCLFVVLANFYENLIFNETAAYVLRYFQLAIGLLVGLLTIQLFFGLSRLIFEIEVGLLMAYMLLGTVFPELMGMIAQYRMNVVTVSASYQVLALLMTFIGMVGAIYFLVRGRRASVLERKKNALITFGLLLPGVLFVALLLIDNLSGVRWHYYAILLGLASIMMAYFKYAPGEIVPINFLAMVDRIEETVLLYDEHQRLIYVNQTNLSEKIDFFNFPCQNCYDQLIDYLWHEPVEQDPTADYINLKTEMDHELYFFRCYKNIIEKEGHTIGYLAVLEDVSDIERTLENLKNQKDQLDQLNARLTEHAKVVAKVEIEQERSRLLLEVQNELGHRLAELTKMIENILGCMDAPEALGQIKESCQLSKSTLQAIRRAVVDYRTSYEG